MAKRILYTTAFAITALLTLQANLTYAQTTYPLITNLVITDTTSSEDIYGGTTQGYYGQSFLTPTDYNSQLNSVYIWLRKVGSPTDFVYFELRTDSSGSPSNTVVATTDYKDLTYLQTTTQGRFKFNFITKPELTANTTYWLVLRRTGSLNNSNAYYSYYGSSNPYANGSLKYSSSGSGSWITTAIGNVDLTATLELSPYIIEIPEATGGDTITNNNYYDEEQATRDNIFRAFLLFLLTLGGVVFYFMIKYKRNG